MRPSCVRFAAPPRGRRRPGTVRGAEPGTVAPLVDRVKGAVVTIQSTKFIRRFAVEDPWNRMLREQFGMPAPPAPRARSRKALGSGFIVDKSGIVLTNNHVVAGADEVIVRLADNRRFAARVLGSDPPTDVAVVRIDKPPGDLQAVTLGDSDRVRVGDYVLAIGNPLGLGPDGDDGHRQREEPRASARSWATSIRATRTSSRPTPRSTRATRAARSSTSGARSSASTPRSSTPASR